MQNEPIKHDKTYPPAASAGPDNAYYLRTCAVVERGPAYASCLFRLSEADEGRLNEFNRDCKQAVGQGRCIAAGMREQERLQGVALYYFPRKPPQELIVPSSKSGDFGVRITNLTAPELIPKEPKPKGRFSATTQQKPIDALDQELMAATTNGFAEAITAATLPHVGPVPEAKPIGAAPVEQPPVQPLSSRPAMLPGETPLQYARRLAASR